MKIIYLILGKANSERINRANNVGHALAVQSSTALGPTWPCGALSSTSTEIARPGILPPGCLPPWRNPHLKMATKAATLQTVMPLVFVKQGGLECVLSITGRRPFWHVLLTEMLPREPLLGHGFMRISYGEYF